MFPFGFPCLSSYTASFQRAGLPVAKVVLRILVSNTVMPWHLSPSELIKPCARHILTRKKMFQHWVLAQDLLHLVDLVWVTTLPILSTHRLLCTLWFGHSSQVPEQSNDQYWGANILVFLLYSPAPTSAQTGLLYRPLQQPFYWSPKFYQISRKTWKTERKHLYSTRYYTTQIIKMTFFLL